MSEIAVLGMFCQDVRDEVEGTHTIVGVFPDNVNVPTFPGSVPTLTLYVRIGFRIDQDLPPPMTLVLISPTSEEMEVQKFDTPFIQKAVDDARTAGNFFTGIIARTSYANLRIADAGHLKAVLRCGDREYLAGALHFKLGPAEAGNLR